MAVLDTIKKIKPLIKTATGYIHLMLSSQSVSMDNGNTLQEEINEINNNLMVLSSKKPVFLSSSAVNPNISLMHESMEDGVIYDFIAVVQSSLDNTTYKQEISASLNNSVIGTNGDNANLMSTFMGQCVKGDVLSISSYKTGGNYSIFFTRVILILE